MLIEILILFFIVLLISQIYLFIIDNNSKTKEENIVEGYTDYEQTTYMLSQKNSLNIEDLKKRIDDMSKINNNYDELNNRLTIVEDKINTLVNDSIANTKGVNFDTTLPTSIDTSQFPTVSSDYMPSTDSLTTDSLTSNIPSTDSLTSNIPSTDSLNFNNMF